MGSFKRAPLANPSACRSYDRLVFPSASPYPPSSGISFAARHNIPAVSTVADAFRSAARAPRGLLIANPPVSVADRRCQTYTGANSPSQPAYTCSPRPVEGQPVVLLRRAPPLSAEAQAMQAQLSQQAAQPPAQHVFEHLEYYQREENPRCPPAPRRMFITYIRPRSNTTAEKETLAESSDKEAGRIPQAIYKLAETDSPKVYEARICARTAAEHRQCAHFWWPRTVYGRYRQTS